MSIKFLVLGGEYFGFGGEGGKCRFYFYGREDFSETFHFERKWPASIFSRALGRANLGLGGSALQEVTFAQILLPEGTSSLTKLSMRGALGVT